MSEPALDPMLAMLAADRERARTAFIAAVGSEIEYKLAHGIPLDDLTPNLVPPEPSIQHDRAKLFGFLEGFGAEVSRPATLRKSDARVIVSVKREGHPTKTGAGRSLAEATDKCRGAMLLGYQPEPVRRFR